MKRLLFLGPLIALSMVGCCANEQRVEPPYPQSVEGWKDRSERGLRIKGQFVLRKGETTDNGRVLIKLVDIIPGDPCAEGASFQRQARAKFQFVEMEDQKVLCEDIQAERGAGSLGVATCGSDLSKFDISAMYVFAINLEEQWVFFELRS